MITYPNNNVQSVPDFQTGRLIFIKDATALTPHIFYDYVKEGFMPVGLTVADDTAKYSLCEYSTKYGDEETYTLKVGETTYTAAPTEDAPAWDINYAAGE